MMINRFNYNQFKDVELIKKYTSPVIRCKIESSYLQYIKTYKLKFPDDYDVANIIHSRMIGDITII